MNQSSLLLFSLRCVALLYFLIAYHHFRRSHYFFQLFFQFISSTRRSYGANQPTLNSLSINTLLLRSTLSVQSFSILHNHLFFQTSNFKLIRTHPLQIHANRHQRKQHANNYAKTISQTFQQAQIFFIVHTH
jgi:hypothetical protein